MNESLNNILSEFKKTLTRQYGEKIGALLCYGSQARGEAGPYSDVDLVLVLDEKIQPSREIDKLIDILTDFNLRYGVLISLLPVSQDTWESAEGPFWRNIRKDCRAV